MAVLPLKVNKETSDVRKDILLDVANKNWLSVLGDNAIKILVQFNAQHSRGEALLGDYDFISEKIGKARGSVSAGISELEAFGFLIIRKIINKKTKLYEINYDICPLSKRWVEFFKNNDYKKFCINLLLDKPIDNSIIDKMQLDVVNSNDTDVEKTLGRLLYLFVERKGFTIEDLLEEERTRMQEDLFPNGFGFGMGQVETDNWQSILTDEEKKDKELMKVVTHYVSLVDYPTKKDIELMKKALVFCYAYQIKNVITHTKNHPKYGASFKSFQYIYNQTVNGQCGTRKNNKAKQKFTDAREIQKRKVNNQTDMGFKRSGLTRVELIERLEEAALETPSVNVGTGSNIEEEAFDFSKLRG